MKHLMGVLKIFTEPKKSYSAFKMFKELGLDTLAAIKGVSLAHATAVIRFPA